MTCRHSERTLCRSSDVVDSNDRDRGVETLGTFGGYFVKQERVNDRRAHWQFDTDFNAVCETSSSANSFISEDGS